MFVVWEDGGVKTPYAPGSIRDRRVEKVQKSFPIQKTVPHTPDSKSQSFRTENAYVAETYQQTESYPQRREPAIRAKQIMTSPVFTLLPTAHLSEAWDVIIEKRFRHIPVLSSQEQLVGILSDRDVFCARIESATATEQTSTDVNRQVIQQIMAKNVLSASPEAEIRAIARILFEERIGAMPIVTEEGKLVGILTRSDILRTVVNEAPLELWI